MAAEALASRASAHKTKAADLLKISELELSLSRWQQRLHQMSESLNRCEVLESHSMGSDERLLDALPPPPYVGAAPAQPPPLVL